MPSPSASEVYVYNPDGERGTLPAAAVDGALQAGFRLETAEEKKAREDEATYGDRPIAAGLAGAGRGLTLGLSDAALTATGAVDPATLKGLEEHNRAASVVGEGLGTAAGLAVPVLGEVSAVRGAAGVGRLAVAGTARLLGEEAAAGLAGRVATHAVGMAAEGTLYGMGNAVSESALGDTSLTAEKLAAHGAVGALLGLGGGALGELASSGVKAVAQRMEGFDLQQTLKGAAEVNAVKSLNGTPSSFKGYSQEEVKALGRQLLDEDLVGASSKQLGAAKRAAGRSVGKALEGADEALGPKAFNLGSVVERALEEVHAPLVEDPALATQAAELGRLLEGYTQKAQDGISFAEANRFKTNLADTINWTDAKAAQRAKRQLQGIFNDEIEKQLQAATNGETLSGFQAAKGLYGNLADAAKVAAKAESSAAGKRTFSLTDQMVGGGLGLLHGGPVGIATGLAGAAANKFLREEGSGLIARGLDKLAGTETLSGLSQGFQAAVKRLAADSPEALGPYAQALAQAAQRGPLELLATHTQLAHADPAYLPTMAKAGFPLEQEQQSQVALQRAQGLGALQQRLRAQDEALDKAVRGFLKGEKAPRPPRTPSEPQQLLLYKRQLAQLETLASNPQALAQKVAPSAQLAGAAPGTASALSATAARAVAYLHQVAPQSPYAAAVPALAREWKPNATQLASFTRQLRAVANPASVLEDMHQGRLTRESVAALDAVYPQFGQALREKVLGALSAHEGVLSYKQRLALYPLLGAAVDASLQPQAIALQQAMYQQHPQKPPGPGASGRPLKLPSSASPTQALEGRNT